MNDCTLESGSQHMHSICEIYVRSKALVEAIKVTAVAAENEKTTHVVTYCNILSEQLDGLVVHA
jgi:hypothetical protein